MDMSLPCYLRSYEDLFIIHAHRNGEGDIGYVNLVVLTNILVVGRFLLVLTRRLLSHLNFVVGLAMRLEVLWVQYL